MAVERMPELSLIDFVGMEDEDIDTDDPMSVIALVCKVALSKQKEWEAALNRRKELKQDGKKLHRKIVLKVRNSVFIKEADSAVMAKKTKTFSFSPKSIGVRKSAREHSKRDTGDFSASLRSKSLIAMQVTKIEDEEKSPKRKRSPEPINVRPLRSCKMIKVSYPAILPDDDSAASSSSSSEFLALQATKVDDQAESHKRSKKPKKENAKEKNIRKRPPKPPTNTGPDPPPDLPESFKARVEQMGGVNPVLVIQKRLFATDLAKHQNRLSIPISGIRNTHFLTDNEKMFLNSRDGKGHLNPIEVKLLDAEKEWLICLRKWDMPKDGKSSFSAMYVLNKPWHKIVVANKWSIGHLIQLWAFRVQEHLALAVVTVDEEHADQ